MVAEEREEDEVTGNIHLLQGHEQVEIVAAVR